MIICDIIMVIKEKLEMKKTIIHILAFFIKIGNFVQKALAPIIHMIIHVMGRLLFIAILPLYNLYLGAKRICIKFYAPLQNKHRLIHLFARRYITHILIIAISLIVTAANLNAYEVKKDETGYNNMLSKLVEKEDYDILQEEKQSERGMAIARYFKQNSIGQERGIDYDAKSFNEPEIISSQGALMKPVLSPIEREMRARDEIIYYAVLPGDTISDIGQKFGISVNTILWENNLTGYSVIRPGQKLAILPTSGIRHKVQRGDTIQKIAKKYSANAEDIIEFNKLASAQDIKIGELLIIPGGKKVQIVQTYGLRLMPSSNESAIAKTIISSGKMIWPSVCKRITQYFTWRHAGVDIACGYGNPVKAAASGTIIRAQGGWNGGYGNVIIIDHGNGTQTLYGHLGKILVQIGDAIEKNQTIGFEGSTGRSTGPHVHFEIRVSGTRRNPLSIVK